MSTTDTGKAKFVKRTGIVVPFATKPVGDLPALAGTVRPLSAAERGAFFDGEYPTLRKAHGQELAVAHLYARHIVSWDFYGSEDAADPLPVTPENVAALPTDVFEQLDAIVRGVNVGNS